MGRHRGAAEQEEADATTKASKPTAIKPLYRRATEFCMPIREI
jgi:hypothetical protein